MSKETLFGGTNSGALIDISDWALDDAIAAKISALLPPRFTAKPVTFDRSRIHDLERAQSSWIGTPPLMQYLAALPASNGVDAYIVVSKRALIASTGRGPDIFGVTVLNRSIGEPGVFALYQISVVDAKTGKQIGYALGHTGVGLLSFREVVQDVDNSYWTATASDFSADQKQKLKSVVFDIVLNSLPYALYSADLIPKMPDATSTTQ